MSLSCLSGRKKIAFYYVIIMCVCFFHKKISFCHSLLLSCQELWIFSSEKEIKLQEFLVFSFCLSACLSLFGKWKNVKVRCRTVELLLSLWRALLCSYSRTIVKVEYSPWQQQGRNIVKCCAKPSWWGSRRQLFQGDTRSWDNLLVRAPDSWSKGCEFKSQQEHWENFLLQGQLCVLTYIQCPFHPHVTTVAHKRP